MLGPPRRSVTRRRAVRVIGVAVSGVLGVEALATGGELPGAAGVPGVAGTPRSAAVPPTEPPTPATAGGVSFGVATPSTGAAGERRRLGLGGGEHRAVVGDLCRRVRQRGGRCTTGAVGRADSRLGLGLLWPALGVEVIRTLVDRALWAQRVARREVEGVRR